MLVEKKIMVVEDNPINRAMLSGVLSSAYSVLEAENGEEALSVLRAHKDEISLILLDIVMPVMDGYTFLSIVKADPALSSIPVIVTTQSDSESDEVAALSHGATDFVAKPYKPQVILHRVASIINLRETAAIINQFQYDRLTGLFSKEFFYQRINEILVQHPDQEYDIICSDIENFKLINDIFGVPAGDRLLCGMADMYTDLVGNRGVCGRFNADQFACMLEHRDTYTDQMFIRGAARINALTNAKNVVIKWGIYTVRSRDISVEQMCDRALLAARSIKGQYGKHFAIYDDELRSKMLREQAITDGMEAALAEEQFVIYLQPKYRIRDDQLAGAEALVRWIHPQWGFQSPAEFIPLFEKNGFITQLDQFVWDKTCALLRQWEDKGYPPLPVSVNVSRSDIYHADLADVLMKTVEKYGLPPSRLHLEITESAYTEDPDQIIDTVSQLRSLGFIIEMDDFGSGYSSLNMLNKMPLDILKLDMKFIQSETAKPVDQGILRFIMGLARWMNLSVVAEGVETKDQLDRLREIGCDFVQGYYFSKPLPCQDFEALIQAWSATSTPGEPDRLPDGAMRPVLLVADEDPQYRQQVQEHFGSSYQVVEAADGTAAKICISSHECTIAAVILSLTLPGQEGFDILDALRQERSFWSIPVIATAPAGTELEDRAFQAGADDFTVKPHTMESLHRRVLRATKITSAQERERVLQDAASRDYLTGLLNRRGLSTAAGALRAEDAPLAVFLFDLDDLKRINDTFGHAEGDRLIKTFSTILLSHTRSTDILARFGGDEFIVIMKQMASEENAARKGGDICRALQERYRTESFPAACSVGIVLCSTAGSIQQLIEHADQALYRAKSGNKGGYCLWKG